MPSPLIDKSKAFALHVIKLCREVKTAKKESVLTTSCSVREQVLAQTSVKLHMRTEKLILSQSCKSH